MVVDMGNLWKLMFLPSRGSCNVNVQKPATTHVTMGFYFTQNLSMSQRICTPFILDGNDDVLVVLQNIIPNLGVLLRIEVLSSHTDVKNVCNTICCLKLLKDAGMRSNDQSWRLRNWDVLQTNAGFDQCILMVQSVNALQDCPPMLLTHGGSLIGVNLQWNGQDS